MFRREGLAAAFPACHRRGITLFVAIVVAIALFALLLVPAVLLMGRRPGRDVPNASDGFFRSTEPRNDRPFDDDDH